MTSMSRAEAETTKEEIERLLQEIEERQARLRQIFAERRKQAELERQHDDLESDIMTAGQAEKLTLGDDGLPR